jgi:hypothetical protein
LNLPYVKWAVGASGYLEIETINIYTGSQRAMVLAESIPYISAGTWRNIDQYNGTIYIGWTGYVGINNTPKTLYTLIPENRAPFYVNFTIDNRNDPSPTQINVNPWVRVGDSMAGCSTQVRQLISASFEQIFDFETDQTKVTDQAMGTSGSQVIQRVT